MEELQQFVHCNPADTFNTRTVASVARCMVLLYISHKQVSASILCVSHHSFTISFTDVCANFVSDSSVDDDVRLVMYLSYMVV